MRALARRIGWSVVVVWAVLSVAFALNNLLPGDPARMVAGPQARPADLARIRTQLGLDRPPLVQYARFWKRLVHVGPEGGGAPSLGSRRHPDDDPHADCATLARLGRWELHVDLGRSFQWRQPVVAIVAARWPRTFALAVAGVFVQLLLGATAGVLAALKRGSWLDRGLLTTTLLGLSAPTFLIALLLQYVFARRLRLLPLDGFGVTLAEHAKCLVLPAVTLGIYGAAFYTRLLRDEISVLLLQDWARTAQAKGLPRLRVVIVHVLRNALVPLATAIGLDFGALLGGAVVTETVFRWPGIGELGVKALLNRDGPVVFACVVVTSIGVIATNLVVDLLCRRLDPRLSAPRASGTR